jgi:hypothetical protein
MLALILDGGGAPTGTADWPYLALVGALVLALVLREARCEITERSADPSSRWFGRLRSGEGPADPVNRLA